MRSLFSSKARSPYTQMYLTHIDGDWNDTPPILIENATATNRAVNLPEFVDGPAGRLRAIGGPALDYYRLYDHALYLQKERRYDESAAAWKTLLDIAPEDADVRRRLGMCLLLAGRRSEAAPYFEKAREDDVAKSPLARAVHLLETGRDAEPVATSANPTAEEHYYLALAGLRRGEQAAAIGHLRQAVALKPDYAEAHQKLAEITGAPAEALEHWRATIRLRPNHATALRRAAWILATHPTLRNGAEAQAMAVRAILLTNSNDPDALDALAAAYAENSRFEDAISTARRAIAADPARAPGIERRIERYRAGRPWRE